MNVKKSDELSSKVNSSDVDLKCLSDLLIDDDDAYSLTAFNEASTILQFAEKLTEFNFDSCKAIVEKDQYWNKYPLPKLRDVLLAMVQFERNLFSMEFVSSKKNFGKWQSIGQDCVQTIYAVKISISSDSSLIPALDCITTYFNIRRELAMFFDEIVAVSTLEAQIEVGKLQCFDSINGGRIWPACLAPMKRVLMLELLLVQLISDTICHLNRRHLTDSLNSLKRAEKCLVVLCQLRQIGLETVSPSSSNVSGTQSKSSTTSVPSKSLSQLLWHSTTKQKNNIITYVSAILNYLGALFGCYFYSTLSVFSTSHNFLHSEKSFQAKNWIHTALVSFAKSNRVWCWLLFKNPTAENPKAFECDIESFLLNGMSEGSGVCYFNGIELVVAVGHEPNSTAESSFPVDYQNIFLNSISKLLKPEWNTISVGTFFADSIDLDIHSCDFNEHESMIRVLYCRYEPNFILITSLPAGISKNLAPSFLRSSAFSTVGKFSGSESPTVAKNTKTAKADMAFKTSFYTVLKKLKGVTSFSL